MNLLIMVTASALYLNPSAPIGQRVEDLLSRMTLEEKVGQMNQCVGVEHFRSNMGTLSEEDLRTNTANAFYPGYVPEDLEQLTREGKIGSFLHVTTLEEANRLQRCAMESRLKIPLIFGIDAIHGNANCPGNTVYPGNLGLAGTFNPSLAREIARQTALEMRAMNMHWTFNPNVEVARDPRWGRCGETFGEDPMLVGQMGAAQVEGYQGRFGKDGVLACIKHLVGGSQPVNGTNGAPCDVSERTLREVFLPPFKAGADAGAATLMTAHNEINGFPAHTNRWLMTDVVRGEWQWPGFIVSDWNDIEHVSDLHRTAESNKEAFFQSIMAGMDMHMHGPEWTPLVVELVKEGRIPESRIDESVRRILETKFRLGLFEQPFADEATTMEVRLCPEHRATALEAARQSIVLLENKNSLLPLKRGDHRKILVTGINADDENIMGDWTARMPREQYVTLLQGLKEANPEAEFIFVDQGWDPRNMSPRAVRKAIDAAKDADLIVCAAGEYMMRFRWMDRTCGEDTDRSDIGLVGLQNRLIEGLAESGKPLILVLINGRPLGVERQAEQADAVIEAWESGQAGGTAIAEIIYGDINPSGKLAITIPRHAGQVQMIYNHKPSAYFHPVAVTPSEPLYPFGYGKSYTTYRYDNLRVKNPEVAPGDTVEVTFDITNTGSREGTEIAQLYLRDDYSSATRPVKELVDYSRVDLKPGQTKTVTLHVRPEQMQLLDFNNRPVYEAGSFTVMAGPSSSDEVLLTSKFNLR